MVVLAFCIMPVCKFGGAMRLPPYDIDKLCKGFFAGVASVSTHSHTHPSSQLLRPWLTLSRWMPCRAQAVCFLVGLDDSIDPFRLFHGLSQALVGLALYYLWQLVPLNISKKTDDDMMNEHLELTRAVGMSRVMSSHDLPVARLEYY